MKKSVLCVVGGVAGGAALVSALGMSNAADTPDLGRFQLESVEAHPTSPGSNGEGAVLRIDSLTGEVWVINASSATARKVDFR